MNNTNRLFVACLIFLCIFFTIIYMVTRTADRSSIRATVYYNTPTPLTQISEDVVLSNISQTEIIPTPTPSARSRPDRENNKRKEDRSTPNVLCTITDLLGYPIKTGVILYNDNRQQFQDGRVVLTDVSAGNYSFVVSADGYQEIQKNIEILDNRNISFQLDYQCDFQVIVYNNSSQTIRAASAEVTIFESQLSPRPIFPRRRVLVMRPFDKPALFELAYRDNELIVDKSSTIHDINCLSLQASENYSLIAPKLNDLVYGIGQCRWGIEDRTVRMLTNDSFFQRQNNRTPFIPIVEQNSSRMRILDSLAFCNLTGSESDPKESIGILHGSVKGESFFYLPAAPAQKKAIAQIQTDRYGVAQIEGLKPGLYYAQARRENRGSDVLPLHPSSGGCKLELSDASDVTVICRLDKMNASRLRMGEGLFIGAKISIQSVDPGRMISAEEEFSYQWVRFKSLPYGRYRISTQLPEGVEFENEQRIVDINQPHQTVVLNFEGWKRHSIEGKVLVFDTQQPVADYALEITNEAKSSFGSTQFESVVVQTDESGTFSLQDVPMGLYFIKHVVQDLDNHTYFPYNGNVEISARNFEPIGSNVMTDDFRLSERMREKIEVRDDPVASVTLYVIPVVKTRFLGTVVDERSNPVDGALLSVSPFQTNNHMPLLTTVPKPKTNRNGEFDVTVLSYGLKDDSKVIHGKIRASVVRIIPRHFREEKTEDGNYKGRFEPEKIITDAYGSTPIDFTFGDTIESVEIVIDGSNRNKLEGWIKGEGGNVPDEMELSVVQNQTIFPVETKPGGGFVAYGLQPGRFSVKVENAVSYGGEPPFNEIHYLSDSIRLDFPHDRDCMYADLTLQESGYFSGRIIAADGSPVFMATVYANRPNGRRQETWTGLNGEFRLNVPKNAEYDLFVVRSGESNREGSKCLSQLQPNLENLIIQM